MEIVICAWPYLRLAEGYKLSYVGGLVDMLLISVEMYFPEIFPYLEETIKDMSGQQVKAIFDKYLEEYPEERHYSAASIFFGVIMKMVNIVDYGGYFYSDWANKIKNEKR